MNTLSQYLYWLLKRISLLFWQIGVYFCFVHFYEPIPDIKDLKSNVFQKPINMTGIDINESKQIKLLLEFMHKYKHEYDGFPREKPSIRYQYFVNNGSFESVDGEVYYCMIRYFKPKKIIEVGAGFSTLLAAQAIIKNMQEDNSYNCKLIAIDPYPKKFLRIGFPGLSRLIIRKVQEVNIDEFDELKENDILFIDSSHVLKIGNDVHYLYNEIFPSLRKGVLVHIHDIFLPNEYPKHWILEGRFWNEQYLLKAFLTFNNTFEILFAGSYMHMKHPDLLERAFPSYSRTKRWPGSFWIKRIK